MGPIVWVMAVLLGVVVLALALLPLPAYFLLHEFIHALAAPGFGFSDRSVIGVWPAGGVAYSYYDGEMSRERLLAVLLAPFFFLTILPLAAGAIFGLNPPILAVLSVLNAIGSYVDIYNSGHFFLRLPAGARVRLAGDGIWFIARRQSY